MGRCPGLLESPAAVILSTVSSVCFYFQVHQPFRIRRYSVFDNDPFYFDNEANESIRRVAGM